eukprot:TRINITY_DN59819_c0_g1_i1.p1 TRINITY_DN59819_c0_g1~~TRINITY_DN59819_c0_g1_i1.p1  ORF type:complete len:367 (+),score=48.73 TRINITY_DN59819_c0_g1_i1:59-1159(+)
MLNGVGSEAIPAENRRALLNEVVGRFQERVTEVVQSQSRDTSGPCLKLPHLGEHDADPDLTVKRWENRSLEAEVQAVQEVLQEFGEKVEARLHVKDEDDKQIVRHAYIMCRIDSGFHCFGLFVENDPASIDGKIKLVFFDPSHMHRVSTLKALSCLPAFPCLYDVYVMCPLHHHEPLCLESSSHYWGITAGREMVPCKRVSTQIILHRNNECGILTYFAMTYFLSLVSNYPASILRCLGVQAVEYTQVNDSVWDDRCEWPQFQNECIPQEVINSISEGGERFVRRDKFPFKALAFPEEFNIFSTFSPVGQLFLQGVEDIAVNEQLWSQSLLDAQLMPKVGDTMFYRNSYLKLMLPYAVESSMHSCL